MLATRKLCVLALVAAATLTAATAARAVEPDKLIPADANAVVVFNVKQTLDSALVKTYALEQVKAALKGNDQLSKALTAAGIDPLKDVDSVVLSSSGMAPNNQMLIVAHGKFDLDKIHAAAADFAKQNPKEFKFTGNGKDRIYEVIDKDNTVYVNLPDANTVVAANNKEYLQKALIKENAGKVSKDLKSAIEKVQASKESVWGAMIVTDEMRKSLADNEQTKEWAPKLESVTGSLNLADDIQLAVFVNTTDAAAAQKVAKAINGVKPLLGLLAGGNDQIKPFVDLLSENLKVNNKDKAATIDLKITETQLKKALQP